MCVYAYIYIYTYMLTALKTFKNPVSLHVMI